MVRIGVIGTPGGWSSEHLADAVAERTGWRGLFDLGQVELDLDRGRVLAGEIDLLELDALVIKKIGDQYNRAHLDRLELLQYVARRGVPAFSDPGRILRVINRLSCTTTLRLNEIPMPPTVITESTEVAAAAVRRFGQAVLKPHFSSKARGMRLLSADSDLARDLAEYRGEGHSMFYVQRRLALPGRDLGLVFVGGEYLAAYARIGNPEAWNTTVLAGGRYEAVTPSAEIIELATRAQAPFELSFTSVDVAETDVGPVVFEVSAFGGFRGLHEAHDLDAAQPLLDLVLRSLCHG